MVLMNIEVDNFYAFKNFKMNFSYPKKIVNSYIENEFLVDRPNFRYKKAVILMGANASGKTSLGRIMTRILNFIDRNDVSQLIDAVGDRTKNASFSIDFVVNEPILYRVSCVCCADNSLVDTKPQLELRMGQVAIGKTDSYETCCKKLLSLEKDVSIEDLHSIPNLGWAFGLTENTRIQTHVKLNSPKRLKVLETVLKVLDPAILEVSQLNDLDDSYVIRFDNRNVIIQDGAVVNQNLLSAGTYNGIEIADMLSRIIIGENGFYYCDEKFSCIQTDVEKEILSIMIDELKEYDQLIFTTHNTDILDLPYPKHTFTFLKKDVYNLETPITAISAADYLKRNTDSLRSAVENDLFGISPSVEALYTLRESV